MDSPDHRETIGDDFDKLADENGGSVTTATHDDHKDHIGEDFDIVGGFGDQHFEVLDSAGEAEGDPSNGTANSKSMDTGNVIPYIGYISTHENLRVLNIRRLKNSDTWPCVILQCIL